MAVARASHRSTNSSTSLPAIPPGTTVTTLDNGLTVILREDRSAPVVSAQAWAQTGSVHEGRWLGAGLSHVLEHMLFKGTATRPPGQIDREVQDVGGYMNAYTSFDRTVYHIDAPNTGALVAGDGALLTATMYSVAASFRVEVLRARLASRLAAFPDDPQIGFSFQQFRQTLANNGVIIGEKNCDGLITHGETRRGEFLF